MDTDGEYTLVSDTVSDHLYPALFQCFTIIICGYIAGRLNVVSKSESKGIATFVGTFALPSLIFLSLARLNFSMVNWTFLGAILLAKGLVFLAVVIVTLLVSKPVHLGQAGMFAIFCTQSNDFALGFPIINAIYEKTHPEYGLYLYLMAPISLAILNPVAFVLLEINKQRDTPQAVSVSNTNVQKFKMVLQLIRGIIFNPVLLMTILGICGNIIFKQHLSIYIEGLLDVFGQSFSAAALFLLGLRMVGQITRLRGTALLLPCVLIMVKLIVLPVVMRECVSGLNAGANQSETQALSTYAFLYGTIPTAPAVFVFSNIYNIETDLMASSMVICTFLSAPITFLSAEVISINQDFADQIKKFGFDLSLISLVGAVWVFMFFTVTKKFKRIPHRLTFCLNITQILLGISVIWGGPLNNYPPSLQLTLQQALQLFSTYSCLIWTSMLAIGLLTLESRGPCFTVTLWPVLAFVAWGAPAVMTIVLLATKKKDEYINSHASDAIRFSVLFFCIILTTGCLILYIRFRRRSSHFAQLSAEVAAQSTPPEESSSLIENAEPTSLTQSLSNFGCYGTITATPSPNRSGGCCTNDTNCNNGLVNAQDIEDVSNGERGCACPSSQKFKCNSADTCPYLNELDRTAEDLGLIPPEQSRGRGGQMMKHTVLIIAYTMMMFLGLTYTAWKVMRKDESGVFIEIEFLDTAASNGQALIMFILFGLDPEEIFIPMIRYLKRKWKGEETLVLPPIENLSFETKHVCDQFITHHLERCKEAIAKDTRWHMRVYRNVFRGSCLVRWLIQCGLANDEHEAVKYARHLLEGRLIAHVNNAHHFSNSRLLYTFK